MNSSARLPARGIPTAELLLDYGAEVIDFPAGVSYSFCRTVAVGTSDVAPIHTVLLSPPPSPPCDACSPPLLRFHSDAFASPVVPWEYSHSSPPATLTTTRGALGVTAATQYAVSLACCVMAGTCVNRFAVVACATCVCPANTPAIIPLCSLGMYAHVLPPFITLGWWPRTYTTGGVVDVDAAEVLFAAIQSSAVFIAAFCTALLPPRLVLSTAAYAFAIPTFANAGKALA